MPSNDLSSAIADMHAELDEITEDHAGEYGKRIDELLSKPGSRDLKAWAAWNVDSGLFQMTQDSIENASGGIRDDKWFFSMGGLRAACVKQSMVEIMALKYISAIENGREKINKAASKMDRAELKEHARIGTPKSEFTAAKERRKNAKAASQ